MTTKAENFRDDIVTGLILSVLGIAGIAVCGVLIYINLYLQAEILKPFLK